MDPLEHALNELPVTVRWHFARLSTPPNWSLLPAEELALVDKAVPHRRVEFAWGRICARRALRDCGIAPGLLLAENRCPTWPKGASASITHGAGYAIAIAAPAADHSGLGIDIEEASPLKPELLPYICTDAEQQMLAGPDLGRLAKLVFSAKECAYKAQYRRSRTFMDFHEMSVRLDLSTATFQARFTMGVPFFPKGSTITGRFWDVDGRWLTFAALKP